MDYAFVIADVVTRTPFGGNQLAVFPDARGLTEERMKDLAREFGFSETTFVFPPEDPSHTCRLRIFTPNEELPFAGHPTVGSASVLVTGGYVKLEAPTASIVIEEQVGPVVVEVADPFGRLTTTTPFQAPPDRPAVKAVASALSLAQTDIRECWYGSVGLEFCYVYLNSVESVDRVALDRAEWSTGLADGCSPHLYVFAGTFANNGQLYARAFAPALGVEEDPATGSAAAGLVASLAQRSTDDGDFGLQIEQGVRMGRPSQIDATAQTRNGRLTRVTVGGHTTVVGRGAIILPVRRVERAGTCQGGDAGGRIAAGRRGRRRCSSWTLDLRVAPGTGARAP